MLGLLFLVHGCVLAALVYCWWRGPTLMAALSQILLGFYPIALLWPGGELAAFLGVIVLGPLAGPLLLLDAASRAPLVGFSALAVAACLGASAFAWVAKTKRLRCALLIGQMTFAITAWVVAELLVEAMLRVQAAEQFPSGYCFVNRSSVPTMIEYGTADEFAAGTHVTLIDGSETYTWSFRQTSFVKQTNANFVEGNPSLTLCERNPKPTAPTPT